MKKIKTILAAAALLLATSAFATTGGDKDLVSTKVKAAFVSDFAKAQFVTWSTKSDFYFAHFTLNGSSAEAAYTPDGELIATSRKVAVSELPLAVSLELASQYNGYDVSTEATEINFDGNTTYYLNVQNNKEFVQLSCTANGAIDVVKKMKKQVVES